MSRRRIWAVSIIPLMSAGFAVGRFHLLKAGPGTFFALGVAAALCVVGTVYFARGAIKIARAGERYGD